MGILDVVYVVSCWKGSQVRIRCVAEEQGEIIGQRREGQIKFPVEETETEREIRLRRKQPAQGCVAETERDGRPF